MARQRSISIQWLLALQILLPVLVAVIFQLSPQPQQLLSAWWLVHKAQRSDQPAQAAAGLQQVLLWQPWRTDLSALLGDFAVNAGDPSQAIKAYEQALAGGQLSEDRLYSLGDAYRLSGDFKSAEKTWIALAASSTAPLDVYNSLYVLQRNQGELRDAENTLRLWRARDPQNVGVVFDLGVLVSLYDLQSAQQLLREAAGMEKNRNPRLEQFQRSVRDSLDASGQPAYQEVLLGRGLGALGDWDLASLVFSSAVKTNPEYADAWAFLGESRQQLGENGWEELKRAAELSPDSVLVQALVALYWRRQNKPELALTYLHQAALAEPDQAIWKVELGNTLAEMGDLIRAMDYYQQAVMISPNDPLYWKMLARFSFENQVQLRSAGLPAARQALLLSPEDPEILDLMGSIFMKLGDLASAERFLQRSLSKDPTYSPAHFHLGQLYLQLDDNDQAYYHLRQAAADTSQQDSTGFLARRLLDRYFGGQ